MRKQESMIAMLAASKVDENSAIMHATKQVSEHHEAHLDCEELANLDELLSCMIQGSSVEEAKQPVYYGEVGVWNARINRRGLVFAANTFFFK